MVMIRIKFKLIGTFIMYRVTVDVLAIFVNHQIHLFFRKLPCNNGANYMEVSDKFCAREGLGRAYTE